MNKFIIKNIGAIIAICFIASNIFIILPSEKIKADSYDGEDLALAILANSSCLIDTSYSDTDNSGNRQSTIMTSHGTMVPTNGDTFALISTGIAGTDIVTSYENEPGDERGTWFAGGKYGYPRDEATLTMTLQVPLFMHYLFYDVQFLSSEYPEYVGTQYNDKLTISVNSPSEGTSTYIFDVNSGYFILESDDITGTGFDVFARSGNPGNVDWLDTIYRHYAADAGASGLVRIVGTAHPVSPLEEITVTINIKDAGDNLFDSAVFVDFFRFSGEARTEIIADKIPYDENGELIEDEVECGDKIKYKVTITNIGEAHQSNNPGNEFEDFLPDNVTYVEGSASSAYGTIQYDSGENKIIWNGDVPAKTSRLLEFEVTVNYGTKNGVIISNQGNVKWDSNEDGTNDAIELTDDTRIDDGVDQDEDGDTDDDDPTICTVVAFEKPDVVNETFEDDPIGGGATQSYLGRDWFETSFGTIGSAFKVISSFEYLTDNSYKTKIRNSGSPQYWNYSISNLEGDIDYWEVWFKCGDVCEDYCLNLDFKNNNNLNIAKIKFEYIEVGENPPLDYYLQLYYWDAVEWKLLDSDLDGGYLRDDWYKLKIDGIGDNMINYSLYRNGVGLINHTIDNEIGQTFSNLKRVEFSASTEPIVCPMFFWDDHKVGII